MTARPRIAVFGDALLDIAARRATPLIAGGDVAAEIAVHPGGQGANVAVRLARRGLSVELTCALADDAAGDLLRVALASAGVVLRSVAASVTGSAIVLVDASGERTMLSQRVPFASLVAAGPMPDHADWAVVSGYLLAEPDALLLADRLATLAAPLAILGCALGPDAAAAWRRAAARTNPSLVVVNISEAEMLAAPAGHAGTHVATAGDHGRLAVSLADALATRVVVTGPSGAAAADTEGSVTLVDAASPPGRVIDSTGAGDAFAAALIAGLARGGGLGVGLADGMALAAAVARVAGAQGRVAAEQDATLPT